VKEEKYDQAIDEYMKCLIALDFSSCKGQVPKDAEKMAGVAVKVPVCNNMAMCLGKKGKFERALEMTDAVLDIEEFNGKAISRKLSYLE
jgi:hypothetical protein